MQSPMRMPAYTGYADTFLGPDQVVPLPVLSPAQRIDLAPVAGTTDNVARYANYSVMMSRSRGFPYFTAANIDGLLFKRAARTNNWRKDERIDATLQWGTELYGAVKSNFDKGHMTKREDVQWGHTLLEARQGADSTFFYTNAVPQHARLNQQIWADLEDYILHSQSVDNRLRIAVFTGPVLHPDDPDFVTPVRGQTVKLPILFWKVVVFLRRDGTRCRVGFLMGQQQLLATNGIVRPSVLERTTPDAELFLQFEEADTYQVNLSTIEKLTGLTLPAGNDLYRDSRPIKLVVQTVDINDEGFSADTETLGFRIPNLVL